MKNFYDNSSEAELINKLKLLEVPPPDGLWNDIETTLKAKRRRKIIIITSWASAATIALFLSIYGMYEMNSSIEKISSNKPISETISNHNIKKESVEKLLKNFDAKETKRNRILDNSEDRKQAVSSSSEPSTSKLKNSISNDEILEKIRFIRPSLNNPEIAKPNSLSFENNPIGAKLASVEPEEKRVKGHWYFSASGFPVYSFHTAGAMNRNGTKQEVGIVSWGGAVSARYSFSNSFSIESGISYNTMGQQEKDIYIVSYDAKNYEMRNYSGSNNSYGQLTVSNVDIKAMDSNGLDYLSTTTINESNFNKVDALQRFRYLEIPFLLAKGYNVKGNKLNLKAGLSAGFLIGNQLDLKNEYIHFKGKTIGVDRFFPSALASIGLSIPIAKNVNLLIEPTFKLGLKSLSVTNGKSYPFSTYIKFGIEIPF